MFNFFQNKECEYFPCHDLNRLNISHDMFNCLFCFCPLYNDSECGGNYTILEVNNIKDCSNCVLPHIKDIGYTRVCKKIEQNNKKQSK